MEGTDVFLRPVGQGRADPGDGQGDGRQADHLRHANPDPEITPEEARQASPHAIIATGRSDYPNQVNNVLGFPYIFRGALDVRASTINEAMKIAAAEALALLAREDVPDEVNAAGGGKRLQFGPGIHHPQRVRPPPDQPPAARRGACCDRERPWQGGRSPTCAAMPASCPPASTRPRTHWMRSARACGPIHSAWCSPRARRRRSSAPPWASATPAMARRS